MNKFVVLAQGEVQYFPIYLLIEIEISYTVAGASFEKQKGTWAKDQWHRTDAWRR